MAIVRIVTLLFSSHKPKPEKIAKKGQIFTPLFKGSKIRFYTYFAGKSLEKMDL